MGGERQMRGAISARDGNQSGYSVIEIAVVVALIGIGASLLWPKMTGLLDELYLRQTAYQLVRDIRFIQQQAMNNPSGGWKLVFVTGRVEAGNYIDEQNWSIYRYEAKISSKQHSRQLPPGFSFSGLNFRNQEIRFTEMGAPVSAGHVTLRNSAGHTLYVIVAPVTGKARIDTRPPD
ncbi:MAG TPA: hypothetical protein DEA44_12370 [Firmicutes bacterium]|nr:hypothetical protein [Bacillota bacterium]